jgi:purine-binding chemotaxis protein CheW
MAESPALNTEERAQRFLLFRVEKDVFALPADLVSEVIRTPVFARVPQAPAALMGIANLRGRVLPLISLRKLLGRPDTEDAAPLAIVLAGDSPVALAVDAVETLVSVETGNIGVPEKDDAKTAFSGIFQTGARGAKIVNVQGLLNTAFAQRAQAKRQSRDTARIATQVHANASPERNSDADMLVTFEIAGQDYALGLDDVREIVAAPESVTAVAHSETLVLGMMVLREELLPVLSMRGLLGFGASAANDDRQKIVIARVGGTTVGLMTDRAKSILAAPRHRIEPLPPVLAARAKGESKITAVYRREDDKLISLLAAGQLFREDVMQRLSSQKDATAKAAESAKARADEQTFLVFRLGKDEFGLPIKVVDEVATVPEKITRVPKTPKFLEGVINLRGAVLPVVDQRRRFEMPKLENEENRRLIVINTSRHRAGIIVDSVSDILRSSADAIDPAPHLTEDTARLIRGVINLEDAGRIVLVLEPAELLTRAEQGLLDAFVRETTAPRNQTGTGKSQ